MAPRAVGTATISFGLVSIPVKLYSSANSSSGISFKLLSKEGHRLKQLYVDPQSDDRVVPRDEMVKGYEVGKDQFVIFEPEELKALQERATESVDITEFVEESQVPRVYFEKTYYLGPDKGGDRAYRLLAHAMRETGRVALAKYAARGKQYLVMVAPMDNGLVLHQLHYADEVVPFSEIPLPEGEVKSQELGLAVQLINQIASDSFRPEQYEDEVKKRVEAAIQKKLEGQAVTLATDEMPKAQIIDLMDALKQSLGAGTSGGAGTSPGAASDEASAEPATPPAATSNTEGSSAKSKRKATGSK